MNLLIDNTSLHSVGRCLARKAGDSSDLANLLQLATEVAFSDRLLVASINATGVAAKSTAITQQLRACGLDSSTFELVHLDPASYLELSQAAARRLARDVRFVTHGVSSTTLQEPNLILAHPELNMSERSLQVLLHETIINGNEAARSDLKSLSEEAEAAGSATQIIMKCDDLWDAICEIRALGTWTPDHTLSMIALLRFYISAELSDYLSKQSSIGSVPYAPSVKRARALDLTRITLAHKLSAVLDSTVRELDPTPLPAPSIAAAIAIRAKGSPEGVIEEAIKVRDKTAVLRSYFNSIVSKAGSGPNQSFEVNRAVRELATTLKQTLGITDTPTFTDTLEIQFLGLIPVPNVKKLVEWASFHLAERRISVISEFAKVLLDDRRDHHAFERLAAQITSKVDRGLKV